MPADGDAASLIAEIEAEQVRLRELLAAADESALNGRPAAGKWSVLENVRHLLFAEQTHLGRFISGDQTLSPLGLPPDGMRNHPRVRPAGTIAAASVWEVLEAWQAVHVSIRELAQQDSEAARTALQRHLRHLRAHVNVIERLLRRARRASRA